MQWPWRLLGCKAWTTFPCHPCTKLFFTKLFHRVEWPSFEARVSWFLHTAWNSVWLAVSERKNVLISLSKSPAELINSSVLFWRIHLALKARICSLIPKCNSHRFPRKLGIYIPWQNTAINLKFWIYMQSAEKIKSWVQSGRSKTEMYEELRILF